MSLFRLAATVLMLVCYALEHRSPPWLCVRAHGTLRLQGAWPLGLVEIVFTIVALRR